MARQYPGTRGYRAPRPLGDILDLRHLRSSSIFDVTVQTPPVSHGDGFRYAQPILRKNNGL